MMILAFISYFLHLFCMKYFAFAENTRSSVFNYYTLNAIIYTPYRNEYCRILQG